MNRASLRSLYFILLCCFSIVARAQLAPTGWPKVGADNQFSYRGTGGNTAPVLQWHVPMAAPGLGAVVGPDGTVYESDGEFLRALDGVTGASEWSFDAGSGYNVFSIEIGANGNLYFLASNYTTMTGTLYALDAGSGSVIWSKVNTEFAEAGISALGTNGILYGVAFTSNGEYIFAVNSGSGSMAWNVTETGLKSANVVVSPNNVLYVTELGSTGFFVFDGATGTLISQTTLPVDAGNCLAMGPNGDLFFSGSQNSVYAMNTSGSVLWTCTTPTVYGFAVGADSRLYVGCEDDTLRAVTGDTGTLLWTNPLHSFTSDGATASVSMDGNGTVYVDETNPSPPFSSFVTAVNSLTGATLWGFQIDSVGQGQVHLTSAIAADGTLYVNDASGLNALASAHAATLTVNPATVIGGNPTTATVTLFTAAPPGGATISISTDGPAATPTQVTIPAGQTSAVIPIDTSPVATQQVVNLSASPGNNVTTQLTVNPPPLMSLGLNPSTVVGGNSSTATLTLGGTAPTGGLTLSLSSTNSAATVPASVTVPAGQSTVTFSVTTTGVDAQVTATIKASSNGILQAAPLTINPASLSSVSLNPTTVVGGGKSTGTVTLSGAAGPSGSVVPLSSSNAAASTPSTVTIPPGKQTASFSVTTSAVNSQALAVISAGQGANPPSATLTINPAGLVSLAVSPSSVLGGTSVSATLTLSGPAGPGGVSVALQSSKSAVVVPASVTVPAGQSSMVFSVATSGVNTSTTATVQATLSGVTQAASLTVLPATLLSVALNPSSVSGGNTSSGTVTLSGPAGPSGTTVTLTSSNIAAGVPSSVTVAAGNTTATFTVTTAGVSAQTIATITAKLNSAAPTASLTILSATVSSLSLNPPTVNGGATSTATLSLSGIAGPGGLVVVVTSSNPAATVPANVTVPVGQSSATFTVSTVGVATLNYATIVANQSGTRAQATLTINASILASVSLSPSSVAGPAKSIGTVTLTGQAGPGGIVVSLSSSSRAATAPASVTIPAGSLSATFGVTATAVSVQTQAVITASAGGITQTATLTMAPVGLASLTLNPSTVQGGNASTGTVTLNGLAPKGGLEVKLTSSLKGVAVPATVTVPAGAMSIGFKATTAAVSTQTTATVTAKFGSESETATLTVLPAVLGSLIVAPGSVTGGSSSTGTVMLNGVAPSGGLIVRLSTNSGSATIPASVTVPAGKASASFAIKTTPVSSTVAATVSASLSGTTVQGTLTVNPPALVSVAVSPSTVQGGKSATGTATVLGPAPTGGLIVSLVSNSSVATVPKSVVIPAGKTSATFAVQTVKVSSKATVTITGTAGGISRSAVLTIS